MSNEPVGFDELIEDCRRPLYQHAINTARVQSLVEDAVQEAIIKIWDVYSKDNTKNNSYYFQTGRNAINSFFRYESYTSVYKAVQGKKRDPLKSQDTTLFSAYADPDSLISVEDAFEDQECPGVSKSDVEPWLDLLTEKEMTYVQLRFYENYTIPEIKEEFGVSYGTWTGAKRKLKRDLKHLVS